MAKIGSLGSRVFHGPMIVTIGEGEEKRRYRVSCAFMDNGHDAFSRPVDWPLFFH